MTPDLDSFQRVLFVLQWAGAALGIAGAFLLALNARVSRWGWLAFLASNVAWIGYGLMTDQHALLLQQVFFTLTSALGIRRWLLRPTQVNQSA